ncbi:hypothetical protein [Leptospira idonii]|uniref:Uncharacterized protein n=1 Tax=Leptospira idonii TaxID=1193500 RepID=A0A4R9M0C1_9LEPT|nr:hypothetical protein [Leptospira idonii]TGN19097.1 hypothetical protein EHS15_10555 [Leptospira idonii]
MIWDKDLLIGKAIDFLEKAENSEQNDSTRPLFYSFALEILCKATLSAIHPTLVADPQNEGQNILYALGFKINSQPKSLPAHSIYKRISFIYEEFLDIHVKFCEYFSSLRNEELHSGESPMNSISEKEWLPRFYEIVNLLCKFMKMDMSELIGKVAKQNAIELIEKLDKEEEKLFKEKVKSHKFLYNSKDQSTKEQIKEETTNFNKARLKHGMETDDCPACGNVGLLYGKRIQEKEPKYDGSEFYVEVVFQSTGFICKSCGLELKNQKEILSANLKIRYPQYENLDLHDFFQPEYEDEYMNM